MLDPKDNSSQKTDNSDMNATQANKEVVSLSKEELDRLLSDAIGKARSDEKDKLYARIGETEKARKDAEDRAKAAADTVLAEKKAREALELKIKEISESDKSDAAKAKETRDALVHQIKSLQGEIKRVEEAAAERVLASELRAFRAAQISESGIKHLADFVTGSSEEEIKKSIQETLAKERAIEKEALSSARAAAKGSVPRPVALNSNATDSSGGVDLFGSMSRREIAQLPPKEYAQWRASAASKTR